MYRPLLSTSYTVYQRLRAITIQRIHYTSLYTPPSDSHPIPAPIERAAKPMCSGYILLGRCSGLQASCWEHLCVGRGQEGSPQPKPSCTVLQAARGHREDKPSVTTVYAPRGHALGTLSKSCTHARRDEAQWHHLCCLPAAVHGWWHNGGLIERDALDHGGRVERDVHGDLRAWHRARRHCDHA